MKRTIVFCLVSLFILLPVLGCAPARKGAEILCDTWGIPHIFAQDGEGMNYAFGWAQMRNHGNRHPV